MRTETSTDDRRAATRRCLARFAAGLALAGLLAPATAAAAPPSNDDRTTPMALGSLPVQVSGTTADATRATTDPFSPCAPDGRQVWYRFTAASDGRVAVRVRADGALDAAVDVYLSERSQTRNLTCDVTDSHGLGAADFTVAKGSDYLIAISQLRNSVAGTFTLTVVTAQPPPRPPGRVLPAQGANGTLDRVGNIQDAYSLAMRAGRTYRIHLSGRGEGDCSVSAALYPPKISDFSGSPVKRFGCNAGGYATYTPAAGEGGRYSILVTASRGVRTLQSFHLEASGAGADDSAPGRFLANRRTAAGLAQRRAHRCAGPLPLLDRAPQRPQAHAEGGFHERLRPAPAQRPRPHRASARAPRPATSSSPASSPRGATSSPSAPAIAARAGTSCGACRAR